MGFYNLSSSELGNFIYLILLLVALVSSVILRSHLKSSELVKQAFLWLIIILFIIVAYSFRYNFYDLKSRLITELLPSKIIKINENQFQIRIADDGHFYIDLVINDKPVRFMIDTGASDIVLSEIDARRIGINVNNLSFNKRYQTANGFVYGAGVTLKEIKITDIVFYNIPASVNDSNMGTSLLGMSFLKQFKKYEFYQDRLVLTY
jgi:aspartyl protease family protein